MRADHLDAAAQRRRHRGIERREVELALRLRLAGRRVDLVDAAIVSRRDLVRLYTRPDNEVCLSITQDVLPALWVEPGTVKVAVRAGVVTLTGSVDRRSTATIVARVVEATPGVVDVVDELGFGFDDGELLEQHWFESHPLSGRMPYPVTVDRTDR